MELVAGIIIGVLLTAWLFRSRQNEAAKPLYEFSFEIENPSENHWGCLVSAEADTEEEARELATGYLDPEERLGKLMSKDTIVR